MYEEKLMKRAEAFLNRFETLEGAKAALGKQCEGCYACGLAACGESCKSCPLACEDSFRKTFNRVAQKRVALRTAPSWYISASAHIRGPKMDITNLSERIGEERFARLCHKYSIFGETTEEKLLNILNRGEEEFMLYAWLFLESGEKSFAEKRRINRILDGMITVEADEAVEKTAKPGRKDRRKNIVRKRRGW